MRVLSYLENLKKFLSKKPPTEEESEQVIEEVRIAERKVEERMDYVAEKLERGAYKELSTDELDRLIEDIEYIIEFVTYAAQVLSLTTHLDSLNASQQRLRYVRTRAQNLRRERNEKIAAAS